MGTVSNHFVRPSRARPTYIEVFHIVYFKTFWSHHELPRQSILPLLVVLLVEHRLRCSMASRWTPLVIEGILNHGLDLRSMKAPANPAIIFLASPWDTR